MVSTTALFLAAATTLLSTVHATTVYVNKGCIVVNDTPVCHDKSTAYVSGYTNVLACVSRESDGQYANCQFTGETPTNWDQAFWGEDNCLYSAGNPAIQVGCSHPISKLQIPNIY